MASITFTGVQGANNGTNLSILTDITTIQSVTPAGTDDNGQFMLARMDVGNGGSGAGFSQVSMFMVSDSQNNEFVTDLLARASNGTTTFTIADIRGLLRPVSLDVLDLGSAENLAEFKRIMDNALNGNDSFNVTGAISLIWGDYLTVPLGTGIVLGNDFIIATVSSVATGFSRASFFGDAMFVGAGTRCIAGDDIIDMRSTAVATALHGDFQSVDGNVKYGNDTIFGGSADDFIYGDAVTTSLKGGDDRLFGREGSDSIFGGGGNDILNGGSGNTADQLNGGAGFDIASYVDSVHLGELLVVDLEDGDLNTAEATDDVLVSIEGIRGRNLALFSDSLFGDAGRNSLWGLDGNDGLTGREGADKLFGGNGNDSLFGEEGKDILAGGAGNDTFVFNTALNAANNVDRIRDFVSADDQIKLSNDIFSSLGPGKGAIDASTFRANTSGQAQDRNDHLIYETDTGRLYYDEDGKGGADRILFAILDGKPVLTAADFAVA